MIGLYFPPHRQVLVRNISRVWLLSSGRTKKANLMGLRRIFMLILPIEVYFHLAINLIPIPVFVKVVVALTDPIMHSCPQAFYLPIRIMSAKTKSHFFKLMKKANLLHLVPAAASRVPSNSGYRDYILFRTYLLI